MKLLELVLSKKKQLLVMLFILYTVVVVWMTLLMREPRASSRVFEPRLFWAFRDWCKGIPFAKEESVQYIQNVIFFIPFGFLFPWKKNWRVVVISALFTSVLIEFTQYIFNLGWCEIDDVISNTLGAFLGLGLCILLDKLYRKFRGESRVG